MIGLADSDQDLDKLIDDVISSAGTVMDNVVPRVETIITNIFDVIDKRLPYLKDTLTSIAVIFAGMKIGSFIQTVVQGFQAAQVQLALYNATANGTTIAQAALNGTLTLGQTVVALFTGKVTLAELATGLWTKAQAALNAVMSANPIMLTVTAVAALAAGILILANNTDTTSKRLKELSERSEEIKKSHEAAVASIDKNTASTMAEAETAKVLRDRLFELDEQLKDNTKTEEEAELVRKDLNSTAEQLNQIIPGIIDNIYDENGAISLQEGAIDSLIQSYYRLMVAKATANAYQAKLDQTASDLIDARELKQNAENAFAEAKANRTGDGSIFGSWLGEKNVDKAAAVLDDATQTVKKYEDEQKKYVEELTKALQEADELSQQFNNPDGNGNGGNGPKTSGGARAKQQTDEMKKEFEKQYKLLNKALEREEISNAEYYKTLKSLRDKYFAEGSDEWEEYTEELGDFAYDTFDDCLDKLEDFKNESLDKINELKEEQEQLKESLMPDKSPVEYGTINGEEYTALANYDKEINQAIVYGKMLDELLQKRADIPQSVIDEIKGMDTEQAMKYMEALLNSSDSQFNAFIESRKKLEEAVSENSTKLMSSEMEEMKRILEEKFGELPEDFFDLGYESGSAFGEAFLAELDTAMDAIRNSIMSQMDAIATEANLKLRSSISAGGGIYTTTNNYNSSYTIGSSKQTATEQLQAARNAATLERLRGGN